MMVKPRLKGIDLFEFQEKEVLKLIDITSNKNSKETLIMKASTGSGKTIVLIDIYKYIVNANHNTAFVWLCLGKGSLEEQSKDKTEKYLPHRIPQNLSDTLLVSFKDRSTTIVLSL